MIRLPFTRLRKNRRGMAAVEFALLAPTMIVLFVGVFEMAFRFQAAEEATRYVHQAADLFARETSLTTSGLDTVYDARSHMMKPVDMARQLDMDVVGVGYRNNVAKDPYILWRRTAGTSVPVVLSDLVGMGTTGESVIFVGVRYHYSSPLTSWFGQTASVVRTAYARPRLKLLVPMDGVTDANGAVVTFGT